MTIREDTSTEQPIRTPRKKPRRLAIILAGIAIATATGVWFFVPPKSVIAPEKMIGEWKVSYSGEWLRFQQEGKAFRSSSRGAPPLAEYEWWIRGGELRMYLIPRRHIQVLPSSLGKGWDTVTGERASGTEVYRIEQVTENGMELIRTSRGGPTPVTFTRSTEPLPSI